MARLNPDVYRAFRMIGVEEQHALRAAAALNVRDDAVRSLRRDMVRLKWLLSLILALAIAILIGVLTSLTH